jgi:hypothetical protein
MRIDDKKSIFQQASPPPRLKSSDPLPPAATLHLDAMDYPRENNAMRNLALTLGSAASLVGAFNAQPALAAQPVASVEVLTTQNLDAAAPTSLAKTEQIAPGTLILSDFFTDAHGAIVENSSRDIGFSSTILRHEAPTNQSNELAAKFFSRLDNKPFEPAEMREFTYNYVVNRQVGNLQSATDELTRLNQMDIKQSALNLSRGSSKAQVMESIYEKVRLGWNDSGFSRSASLGQTRVNKLAPALGVDPQALLQGKAEATAEFQKKLLALIDEATADKKVAQAQQDYDKAVREFEAKGNSVVVAAANSGKVLQMMEQDAQGVTVAPDFFRNLLANDQVTTVGATKMQSGKKEVAHYTNPDPGIDVYANGDTGDHEGTSFATPRVGSIMAELHRQNPNASSADVENMLKKDFGGSLNDYGAWVKAPAVDEAAAKKWLSGSKGK